MEINNYNIHANSNKINIQVSLFLTRFLGGKTYFLLNREEIKELPKINLTTGEKLGETLQKILNNLGKVKIEKSGFLKFVNNYSTDPHTLEIGMVAIFKGGEPIIDKCIWYRSDKLPEKLSKNIKSSIMAYLNKDTFDEF